MATTIFTFFSGGAEPLRLGSFVIGFTGFRVFGVFRG
jgi:hypothetical protein